MDKAGDIYISTCHDVWANQAYEQWLFQNVPGGGPILFLWQNRSAVVMGRLQNPWLECDWQKLKAQGGQLARRISGGGAVYHDMGNLNYTFITGKAGYRQEQINDLLLTALKELDIPAALSGRNDILAAGRKFSGQAFAFNRENALHHGTLLIHGDFDKMNAYLHPRPQKLQAKGIASVRARVVNLRELQPSLSVEQAKAALIRAFAAAYPGGEIRAVDTRSEIPAESYRRFSSWEWIFGQAPPFESQLEQGFPWGNLQMYLQPRQGLIRQAQLYSDALDADFIEGIAAALQGVAYRSRDMAEAVARQADSGPRKQMAEQIAAWLAELSL
ncbi:MAG: lipoate--protein ligase [Firmicutes bacterium]|nr:lipoate--protein ligase [Bacillota bacterium]